MPEYFPERLSVPDYPRSIWEPDCVFTPPVAKLQGAALFGDGFSKTLYKMANRDTAVNETLVLAANTLPELAELFLTSIRQCAETRPLDLTRFLSVRRLFTV